MFQVGDKYAGRSRAIVIDNVDPLARGRIRINHPLLGDSVWIDYLKLPGVFDVPKKGDVVYVECDCGWESHPIAWGNITKTNAADKDLPDCFKRKNPTNRGFYSPGGHIFELDDGEGVAKTGKAVRITTSNGTKFSVDADKDAIFAEVVFGDKWELSKANGFQVSTPASGGTSLSMKSGQVVLSSAQASATLDTNGDIIIVGPAASASIKADGEMSLNGPAGSVTIGNDGTIDIKNAAGGLMITSSGQVELKGAADGIVALIEEFARELSTDTFAGYGAPAGKAAVYAAISQRAAALKA